MLPFLGDQSNPRIIEYYHAVGLVQAGHEETRDSER